MATPKKPTKTPSFQKKGAAATKATAKAAPEYTAGEPPAPAFKKGGKVSGKNPVKGMKKGGGCK